MKVCKSKYICILTSNYQSPHPLGQVPESNPLIMHFNPTIPPPSPKEFSHFFANFNFKHFKMIAIGVLVSKQHVLVAAA